MASEMAAVSVPALPAFRKTSKAVPAVLVDGDVGVAQGSGDRVGEAAQAARPRPFLAGSRWWAALGQRRLGGDGEGIGRTRRFRLAGGLGLQHHLLARPAT